MHLSEVKPMPALAQFVRLYRIIDFEFPNSTPIPPKTYTPRPEHCLQFFPSATQIAYAAHPAKIITPKNALIIGQHTLANNRTVYQKFLSVQVIFQPGALFRLLGIPLTQFTNQVLEAGDVMGSEIERVNNQLYHAASHTAMIAVIERFLLARFKQTNKTLQPIDMVAGQMLNTEVQKTLDEHVDRAFLSHRQFDRQFIDRVGISPKAYLRVVRFDRAYRMKNLFPQMNWFNIAIACGYYDYQHLSKDFKDFTGHAPAAFFAIESPERVLGTEEIY